MRPHLSKYWKIPPDENAAFVASMEDVLGVYQRPYDRDFPVVCMDESTKQLIGEVADPIAMTENHCELIDHEYVRKGVATIFAEVEPLGGRRHVKITQRRTAKDWAEFIREMLDERYPDAKKVILVLDNLNIHKIASLYEGFPAEEARRLADRLELHFTPVHGSWLNICEIELSVLGKQCLNRRIEDMETITSEVKKWQEQRNNKKATIDWQFTNEKARVKLKRLYPKL